MSLSIKQFDDFFRALYQDKQGKPIDPFPWQSRLANEVFEKGWPDCIDLPTASGKTAAIDIAVFVLACQAKRKTNVRTVGRRILFTVNRRVIVDEAFHRSFRLAEELLKAESGILKEVADALHEVGGNKNAPPLDVAELRGGMYRDRAWARSITQPIVVCTTADQLGSRLLFRGYGVSPSMQPIHAALTGCDSLILLDEAHVTKAFCETMQLVAKHQHVRTADVVAIPPMRFVQMTATPTSDVNDRFGLDNADRSHPILKTRQEASKSATLIKLGKKKPIPEEIVPRAFAALSDSRKAVGIIVNRVQTAREIEQLIHEEIDNRTKNDETFGAEVHLVIGSMRPIDRDDLQEHLRILVGPDRPNTLDRGVFIVATQCLEVGADYDFDALITECASIDALRQRFGRLNRKGRPIEAIAAIVTNEETLKGDDFIYGDAIKHTWEWLWSKKDENNQIDFGAAKFHELWDQLDDATGLEMLAPAPHAAVLLPSHLDALCQTNPQPVPSPDVSCFIHGPQRDNAEVNVCWRADLGEEQRLWPDIVRLLPPTSPECMTVPMVAVKRWMGEQYKTDADADVPTRTLEVEDKRSRSDEVRPARVVIWRYGRKPGDEPAKNRQLVGFVTDDPDLLKPGDTVVMPVSSRSWFELGHIPNVDRSSYKQSKLETDDAWCARCESLDVSVDIAERAVRQSKLRLAIRLHEVFPGRADVREVRASELRSQLRPMLEKEIMDDDERLRALAVLDSRFERHPYESSDEENPETKHSELIVFKTLIEPPNRLALPAAEDDDGEDDLSESNDFIPLEKHTEHVDDRMADALGTLQLNGYEPTIRTSAHLHDCGKADIRFNAMLAGITPFEAMMRPTLLGKGDGRRLTAAERATIRTRAMLPVSFRHEMLSTQMVEHRYDQLVQEANVIHDLLLHLIAAHHGYARPFAPVVIDDADHETRLINVNGLTITSEERQSWIPSHRLDSGVAERFWRLTREHGWWGLAWLESILRLADQQASAAEQEGKIDE